MLEDIDRHALFNELHRAIEEAATSAARTVMGGPGDLTYPPNPGFLPDEAEAIASLPRTPALERAIRKVVADAAAYPLFHLLCLMDGVTDPVALGDGPPGDPSLSASMLHDGLYESYWEWRRGRPDPGWRLDTFSDR